MARDTDPTAPAGGLDEPELEAEGISRKAKGISTKIRTMLNFQGRVSDEDIGGNDAMPSSESDSVGESGSLVLPVTLPQLMVELPSRADPRRVADAYALSILNTYWDKGYPVNSREIAARMNIDVRYVDISGRVSGMILKAAGEGQPVIFIDRGTSAARMRFTIAHEIGHYVEFIVMKGGRATDAFGYTDPILAARIPTKHGNPDLRDSEFFADSFAHSLLMPSWEVASFAGLGFSPSDISRYFGVSDMTMINRLHELEIEL